MKKNTKKTEVKKSEAPLRTWKDVDRYMKSLGYKRCS